VSIFVASSEIEGRQLGEAQKDLLLCFKQTLDGNKEQKTDVMGRQ
jgi:hypothetical protein